jgi:hypothetical protein
MGGKGTSGLPGTFRGWSDKERSFNYSSLSRLSALSAYLLPGYLSRLSAAFMTATHPRRRFDALLL